MGFTTELVGEMDAVGDWGLLSTDADLTITGWNRWLERHGGRPAAAVLGRPLFEVFPDLPARKLDRYYRQALGGQVGVLSQRFHKYLLPLAPPPGGRFPQMQQTARVVPLTAGGAVCGTVTVVEDVTERVAYETELRERVEALREADRRKDEFLATLAHELRNPLAPIRNALEIMRLTTNPAGLEQARGLIERQVGHMVRLVDDLLEVSRITRGKVDLQMRRLDVRAVVDAAVESSRPLIEAARHALAVDVPAGPVEVVGDLTRLAQVLANLLNNAAKYTPPGGRIRVTAGEEAGQAVVRVEDNGLGIAPEMLPRVFELFTQVDHSLERSKGGLGIGLALVRKLVELHRGTVEGHSAGAGRGSTFTVRLPLAGADTPAAPGPAGPALRAAAEPRRVLVADDHPDAASSLAAMLELAGHTVRIAHDGAAAVAASDEFRPHVVFMDVGMPGLNGYDACRRIRSAAWGADMVLVALTGWGREEDRRRAADAGFDAHLVKPPHADELAAVMPQDRPAPTRTSL